MTSPIDELCTLSRRKRGKGFEYFDKQGVKLTCRLQLSDMKAIAIPPMWQAVKISADANSKVQAFGFDAKQRRQYIYHPRWLEKRQAEKFNLFIDFAKVLPDIRAAYHKDCERSDWSFEHVSAIVTPGVFEQKQAKRR